MLVLATMMLPTSSAWCRSSRSPRARSWSAPLRGLWLVGADAPSTSAFFMRQEFLTIPPELEEAANIDGAGHFDDLAGDAAARRTVACRGGDYHVPGQRGTGSSGRCCCSASAIRTSYTVPARASPSSAFQYQTLWPQLMAASVIAILPIVVIFLIFQRYFVAGVVASGVKG